jgi:outer membrane immunogenic protein
MKKAQFASVVLATFAAGGAASAADLAVRAPYPVAPAFSWTGFYIGAQAGGGAQFDSFTGKAGVGGLAGGVIGYNYQVTNAFVVGIEGEGFWSDIRSRADLANLTPGGFSSNSTETNTAFYDVAVRFGYLRFERTMVYGKVGAVWSNQKYNYSDINGNTINSTWTTPGVLIGGGFEHAITNNWLARWETDLLVFDATDATFNVGGTGFTPTRQTVNSINVLSKLGISYKF